MISPDLVLFTAAFPYDGSESVLSAELDVIAERFGRVFVVPSGGRAVTAELPPNATVVNLEARQPDSRRDKLRALRSPQAAAVLARTVREPTNVRPYVTAGKSYLDILAASVLRAELLRGWIEEQALRTALFYDYWFENATLSLALLRRARVIRCAVCRAHRFDVFDTAWNGLGRVPFRDFKADHLDAIFAVSEDAERYLQDKLGRRAPKVSLARLGVPLPASYPHGRPDPPVVVTCSALLPRKQVHLVPAVLSACGRPLHWLHLGDGPERARVESAAARLPPDVSYELRGQVSNADVLDLYRAHPVSALLSLSVSEGVPVSMMEAQSFGIPIVARAVGGIPELVTSRTGALVPADAPLSAIGRALAETLDDGGLDPTAIRVEFAARYQASPNYAAFADKVLNVWSSSA